MAVGEINDPIPNARAKRLNGPAYAVLFNSGLPKFLYRITRALSTRFSVEAEESNRESVSFEEMCRIITDIFFWYVETGQAFGPSYPITKHQMMVASMLAVEAESFFLAHELGHIFNEIKTIAEGQSEHIIQLAWEDEFAADQFALDTFISSRNHKESPVPLDICYAGAEIAISIFAGLETVGVEFEGTHPPASERLSLLREHLRNRCADDKTYDNITGFAKPLDLVFENIIGALSSPDWQDFLDRAANDVMMQIDSLLEDCTGGMVPDYATFRAAMPEIFERIASYRLYERVARIAADFFSHMEQINNEGDAAVNKESWVAFQKYKLFISTIESLNEPARSLLEEAMGMDSA